MSYDTVHLYLRKCDCHSGTYFFDTQYCLDNVQTIIEPDGSTTIRGDLIGENGSRYNVKIREEYIALTNCSLSKWYMGNNISELDIHDTREAIERLSGTLCLPMEKAIVSRFDFAINTITKYPTTAYLSHLGLLSRYVRLLEPYSLYYKQANVQFVIYDKIKEQKAKRGYIPDLYMNSNLTRIEQRYLRRTKERFGHKVLASMLYDKKFYNMLLKRLFDTYNAIQKINDTNLNFELVKTKTNLYNFCIMAYANSIGGANALFDQIEEAKAKKEIEALQAHYLREAVKKAYKADNNLIVPNPLITELNGKVRRAIKFY